MHSDFPSFWLVPDEDITPATPFLSCSQTQCKYFINFYSFCVAMEIRETGTSTLSRLGGLFSNMADFHGNHLLEFLKCLWRHTHAAIWLVQKVDAILALDNNSIHCPLNNSILSFSAPNWLPSLWAMYSPINYCTMLPSPLELWPISPFEMLSREYRIAKHQWKFLIVATCL